MYHSLGLLKIFHRNKYLHVCRYNGLKLLAGWLEGDGTKGSRFGTTIVNIGDISGDGFMDIAVGAPREHNGAVYIFNGGKNGLVSGIS